MKKAILIVLISTWILLFWIKTIAFTKSETNTINSYVNQIEKQAKQKGSNQRLKAINAFKNLEKIYKTKSPKTALIYKATYQKLQENAKRYEDEKQKKLTEQKKIAEKIAEQQKIKKEIEEKTNEEANEEKNTEDKTTEETNNTDKEEIYTKSCYIENWLWESSYQNGKRTDCKITSCKENYYKKNNLCVIKDCLLNQHLEDTSCVNNILNCEEKEYIGIKYRWSGNRSKCIQTACKEDFFLNTGNKCINTKEFCSNVILSKEYLEWFRSQRSKIKGIDLREVQGMYFKMLNKNKKAFELYPQCIETNQE